MGEPIRVLQVVSSMNLGGIQSLLMNLYRHIDRDKIQFDFIVHVTDKCVFAEEIESLGGRIFIAPKINVNNFLEYINYWEDFFSQHREYRIVHGHIRTTASIYLGIANKYGMITIAHSHSTYVEPGLEGVVKSIMEYPLRYIARYRYACSREAAMCLFGKRKAKETIIINNAIEVQRFAYNKGLRESFRNNYAIKETNIVAGTVGRIVEAKNPYFLVKVIKACIELDNRFVFIWVGEGNLLNDVKKLAKDIGIAEQIRFIGGLSTPEAALNAMDCFVLPSKEEGFGISAVEAQANGLPVILSDTIPESVRILDTVESKSLDQPPSEWAELIIHMCKERRSSDTLPILKAGFDIRQVANDLQNQYISFAMR